jgi:hypothetical protein
VGGVPVVLPESSPSVTPGSLSTAELAREMAGTPSRTDIADAGIAAQLFGISGTQQFTGGDVDPENMTQEELALARRQQESVGMDPDPNSQTPLQALGAYFTPNGMF